MFLFPSELQVSCLYHIGYLSPSLVLDPLLIAAAAQRTLRMCLVSVHSTARLRSKRSELWRPKLLWRQRLCRWYCLKYGTFSMSKWWFPKMGDPPNGWFIRENTIKMDGLGVPLFQETKWIAPSLQKEGASERASTGLNGYQRINPQ